MQESHPPHSPENSLHRMHSKPMSPLRKMLQQYPYTRCISHMFSGWSCWLHGQKWHGSMTQPDVVSIFRQCSVLSQYLLEGLSDSSASWHTSHIRLGRVRTFLLKSAGGLCYSDTDQATKGLHFSLLSHHLRLLSKCQSAWRKKRRFRRRKNVNVNVLVKNLSA